MKVSDFVKVLHDNFMLGYITLNVDGRTFKLNSYKIDSKSHEVFLISNELAEISNSDEYLFTQPLHDSLSTQVNIQDYAICVSSGVDEYSDFTVSLTDQEMILLVDSGKLYRSSDFDLTLMFNDKNILEVVTGTAESVTQLGILSFNLNKSWGDLKEVFDAQGIETKTFTYPSGSVQGYLCHVSNIAIRDCMVHYDLPEFYFYLINGNYGCIGSDFLSNVDISKKSKQSVKIDINGSGLTVYYNQYKGRKAFDFNRFLS